MATFDPEGSLGPHVRRQVEAMTGAFDDIVVVSTSQLTEKSRRWLEPRVRLVDRANFGYDFFSYKVGLDMAGDLTRFDEVVICNDSYVPLLPYDQVLERMSGREVDFWGLTESRQNAPHLQSFFVAFRPWVVQSRSFGRFWSHMKPISWRQRVINQYELGLTAALEEAGFRWNAYFEPTEAEGRLAQRRMSWYASRLQRLPRNRAGLADWDKARRAPWNPTIGLADAALADARLPFVKLATLRYDPYGLNAEKLLALSEQRWPDAFDGVRAYLQRTRRFYPTRPGSDLGPVPPVLRPLQALVEYGRAA